ncbi:MAG: hypothetical protein ABFD97_16125 [Syntrophobacter sp.]
MRLLRPHPAFSLIRLPLIRKILGAAPPCLLVVPDFRYQISLKFRRDPRKVYSPRNPWLKIPPPVIEEIDASLS